MSKLLIFIFLASSCSSFLNAVEFVKPYEQFKNKEESSEVTNDLVYGDGTSQIDTELNAYDSIIANQPIQGTIFVTHDNSNIIDETSFKMGSNPLTVKFVQTTQMSLSSPIVVSIYNFEIPGLPLGNHTLPPISVTVGGKVVQALPLNIEVFNK